MSKSNINLPKTAFSMKANLQNKEPGIIDYWDKINLYEKLRSNSKGEEKFILHDGPPYANGDIHMGTALNKIQRRNSEISSNERKRCRLCAWLGLPWFAN